MADMQVFATTRATGELYRQAFRDTHLAAINGTTHTNDWTNDDNDNQDETASMASRPECPSCYRLYAGFALGRVMSVGGRMRPNYELGPGAWFNSSSFQQTAFQNNDAMSIQAVVGMSISDNLRIDASWMNYSGISMLGSAQQFGGNISSEAIMLNVYHNLDSYTGRIINGIFRPYIGIGAGVGFNTIADWIYNTSIYQAGMSGSSTTSLAGALEFGLTAESDKGLMLDFFVRWTNLGRVSATGWMWADDLANNLEYNTDEWRERGIISMLDMGVRLRLQL